MFVLFKHIKPSKFYIIFALVFVTTFLGVLFGTAYYNVKSTYYLRSLPDDLKDNINILVAGIDDMGTSADAIVVATVEPVNSKIKITSIPSNTMIKVIDTNHPLKNIYSIGGQEMLLQKVSELLNIDIKYYAFSRFSSFEEVIDILGGVEFDVPYDMYYTDKKQELTIDLKKGKQVLDGEAALKLIRFSKSETETLERDRIIKQFFKELINQKLNDKHISKFPSAIKEVIRNTTTNLLSYDTDTYIALARSIIKKNIEINTINGEQRYIDGYMYFIPDNASITEIFNAN